MLKNHTLSTHTNALNKSQGAKIAEEKRVAAEGIKAAKEAKIVAQVKAIKMVVFFFLFLLSLVCYDQININTH